VAGELQDLLPHRPQKVIFRIGYFTAEDSAETLRQAVEEAYDAQTIALPPLRDDLLAGLVQALADSGAGVVGLTQHTRTLEEIFLTLTAPKEVG